MDVVRLDARIDFRLEKLAGMPVWYVPADAKADAALDDAWWRIDRRTIRRVTRPATEGPHRPCASCGHGAWRVFHSTICASSRSRAADYLRIAHEYHTIILDHVPAMTFDNAQCRQALHHPDRHALRHDVKLIASAAAEPDELYCADEGFEAQEFKRTASRLIEMRSQAYLAQPHGAAHARGGLVGRYCRDLTREASTACSRGQSAR